MADNGAEKTFKIEVPPGGPGGGPNAPGPGGRSAIALKGVTYSVIEMLGVVSGEADIFIVSPPGGGRLILKHYRRNIEPKLEIVEMLSTVGSDRVVRIIDYGVTDDGRFYELQEFAEHGSLDAFMRAAPDAINDDFIRDFVRELNECLSDIHSKNIIHRDIKPSNILIRSVRPLSIALTDFGISSMSASLVHQTNYNRTITYAAPEALSGVVSKASDYWPLGMIVLEMLLKKHPFDDMDPRTITYNITTRDVPGIDSVSADFYPLVKGTLNRDDKKRWQYSQVRDWLAEVIKNDFYEPFSFYGAKCLELRELAANLVVNWERAAREVVAVKQWLLKNLTDRGLVAIVKEICRAGASGDASLFELIYILDPGMKMIFKKIPVTREMLCDLSFKIYDGESSEQEMAMFDEIIDAKLFNKYRELASKVETETGRALAEAEDECFPVRETVRRAEIVLRRLAPERLAQKSGLYKIILRKFSRLERSKAYALAVAAVGLILILIFVLIDIFD